MSNKENIMGRSDLFLGMANTENTIQLVTKSSYGYCKHLRIGPALGQASAYTKSELSSSSSHLYYY